MKYASVCSGIEGASLAWRALGWSCAFVSEIEPFPCAVLKHHYPDVPNFGDLTRYREWPHAAFDVLVGGTPCQSFSVAGLRAGLADPRGNLALVFLGVVDRYRPRWVVWENVPGVLSSSGGRDFGAFLGGLAELGYGIAYRVLDAQYFGVAQRRRRVFVVGYLGDGRPPQAVLFEPESLSGHPAPSRTTGEGVAGAITGRVERGGTNSEGGDDHLVAGTVGSGVRRSGQQEAAAGLLIQEIANAVTTKWHSGPEDQRDNDVIAHALTSGGRETGPHGALDGVNLVAHSLKADGFDASEDGTGRGVPLVADTLREHPRPGSNSLGALTPALVSNGDAHSGFRDEHGLVAGTITQANRKINGRDVDTEGLLIPQATAVRRLTPAECEKLQGLPPGYTLVPYRGKPAADGPRYKAIGNGFAVPVVRWIGERIALVESVLEAVA